LVTQVDTACDANFAMYYSDISIAGYYEMGLWNGASVHSQFCVGLLNI